MTSITTAVISSTELEAKTSGPTSVATEHTHSTPPDHDNMHAGTKPASAGTTPVDGEFGFFANFGDYWVSLLVRGFQ